MHPWRLLEDDRAVPPVIGVILLVAITVVLAAVAATFFISIGGEQSVSPTANFDFDYEPDTSSIIVSHGGGDTIQQSNLYIRGESIDDTGNWAGLPESKASGEIKGESGVVSGDTANITGVSDDYVIRVVWESSSGETSSELAVDRGPSA